MTVMRAIPSCSSPELRFIPIRQRCQELGGVGCRRAVGFVSEGPKYQAEHRGYRQAYQHLGSHQHWPGSLIASRPAVMVRTQATIARRKHRSGWERIAKSVG